MGIGSGDGYRGDDGLSCPHFGEGDGDVTTIMIDVDHTLVGLAVVSLCPDVKVADNGLAVDGDVEAAQSLCIVLPVPGLDEEEFHTVFPCLSWEMIAEGMSTETGGLEQRR